MHCWKVCYRNVYNLYYDLPEKKWGVGNVPEEVNCIFKISDCLELEVMNPEQRPWKCYTANARMSRVALDGTTAIFTQKALAKPRETWTQVQL